MSTMGTKHREVLLTCRPAKQIVRVDAEGDPISSEQLWREAELSRERSWQRNPARHSARLRHRAFLAARSLPILPCRTVLELGAGSGVWTEHLSTALNGQNPVTAAVFNLDLARNARSRELSCAQFIQVEDLREDLRQDSFDYVVGTDIVTEKLHPSLLEVSFRCLKPGGQLLFFTENTSNPLLKLRQVFCRALHRDIDHDFRENFDSQKWTDAAFRQGFRNLEITPFEVIAPRESLKGQAIALLLDRAPVVWRLSKVAGYRAVKPADVCKEESPQVDLAKHRQLFGAVSVVVPCRNEEANIVRLVNTLLGLYGNYIGEIIIVDDNSTDGTADVAVAVASAEPRVRLVRRKPPGGVGRALRDGYAAANGKYILSIDCDFIAIAAEFSRLFDAVAEGYDGAIGSRFSMESALVRYPFLKLLCNRGYHSILNLLFRKRVRDVSNNLKLYRADILKNLDIEEDGFAANVETGLKPLLLNYRIREVPTSWINRAADMGNSSFSLLRTGPAYFGVLFRTAWKYRRRRYHAPS